MHTPNESIDWLTKAIAKLPSDDPVPLGTQGYNTYTTQKDHWLGWLNPSAGTGTYPRTGSPDRTAKDVYNRIVEPKLLLWLVRAAEVDSALVASATEDANNKTKLASKSAAVRKRIPWSVLSAALHRKLQSSAA
jgi:hypothetical protein